MTPTEQREAVARMAKDIVDQLRPAIDIYLETLEPGYERRVEEIMRDESIGILRCLESLLSAPQDRDVGTHDWFKPDFLEYECCRKCGIVRRRDDKNKPCKGVVKLRPLEQSFGTLDQTGWLIERDCADGIEYVHTFADWTRDANKALRFHRKGDAEDTVQIFFDEVDGVRVVEHMWCSSTPPSIAVIPDGWQLVPKTPTLEMLSIFAGVDFIESAFNNLPLAKQKAERDAYAKMLAVAPPLPFPDLSEIWREAFENLWDAAKEVHTLGASQGGQWSQLALALEQSSKFISASPSPVVDVGRHGKEEKSDEGLVADAIAIIEAHHIKQFGTDRVAALRRLLIARIAIKDEARKEAATIANAEKNKWRKKYDECADNAERDTYYAQYSVAQNIELALRSLKGQP